MVLLDSGEITSWPVSTAARGGCCLDFVLTRIPNSAIQLRPESCRRQGRPVFRSGASETLNGVWLFVKPKFVTQANLNPSGQRLSSRVQALCAFPKNPPCNRRRGRAISLKVLQGRVRLLDEAELFDRTRAKQIFGIHSKPIFLIFRSLPSFERSTDE